MEATLAVLNMAVSAGPAETAAQQLERLTKAANDVDAAFGRTSRVIASSSAQTEKSTRGLIEVTGNALNTQGRYTHSVEANVAMLIQNAKATDALTREQTRAAKQVEALTRAYDPLAAEVMKTNRQIEEAIRLQGAQGPAVDGLRGKLANLERAHGAAGNAAKLQTYQLLNLGRQGADVFVSLASGQALWMVAVQQGAQVGEVFAEAATQGVTFKAALAGIAEAAGPVIALLGPIVLIGGAITAAAVAFNEGDKEAAKLANTLALAGSNAGITAVQFEQFSRQVAGDTKTSVDAARSALLGLTETGKFTGETIKVLGEDVVMFSRLTGKSSTEAVSYFAQMGSGASDFLTKFQEAYGGMRLSQIEHIQLLERQGNTTQAQLEAAILVHQRLGKAGPENLGYLEKAWRGVGDAVKDAWTWLKMWGNEAAGRANAIQNIQDQIRLNNERLQGNPATGKGNGFLDEERRQLEARNKGLQGQLTALKAVEAAEQKRVQDEAKANQTQADGIAAAKEHADSWAKIAANVSLATQEIERYRRGQADIRAANPTSKELDSPTQAAAIEAAIRKRYEHLTKQPAVSAATRADNRGDNAIEQAKAAELTAQLATTRNVEQIAGIKAAQIAQELNTQKVRLAGQVEEKRVNDADAKSALAAYEKAAAYKKAAVDQQLAAELLQGELASRQAANAFLDQMDKFASEAATTQEERNAIELAGLKRRQDEEAYALGASNALKVATGEISAMAAAEAELRQKILAFAQTEAALRAQGNEIIERDLRLRQEGLQNDIDVLQSRQGIAQSEYEAARIQRQIIEKRYDGERIALEAVLAKTGVDADTLRAAKDRLSVLDQIKANELKQLDLTNNMLTAMTSAINAIDQTARAFKSGDIGAGISGLSKSLSNISGLLGSSSGLGKSLGGIADFLGPIGGLVSGVTSLFGGLFGGSSKKKKARAAAAAQAAAEEADRQATIADTGRQIEIDTLRASGNEIAAVALERKGEIDALTKLDPALAAQKQAYYDIIDAAEKKAKADAEEAEKAAKAAESQKSQRAVMLDLMALDDAVLGTRTAELERRKDELATMDPATRALKEIYYARIDEGEIIAKNKAALEAEEKAKEAAYEASGKAAEGYAAYAAKIDEAAQAAAASMRALGDSFQTALQNAEALSKSLQSFADGLLKELGLGGSRASEAASKSALLGSIASGGFDQQAAQAYLDAAKENSGSSGDYQAKVAWVRSLALSKVNELNAYPAGLAALLRAMQADAQAAANPYGAPRAYAEGGVFTNGIVTQPTLFNPSVMGEAGPEAIMPLVQGPGGLGVRVHGGASNDNSSAALRAEIASLKQELGQALRQIAASNDKIETYLRNPTEGGSDAVNVRIVS